MLHLFQRRRAHTRRGPRSYRFRFEQLEDRTLLSVFTPVQVRHAYGFDQVTFPTSGGGSVVGDGSGQTIAIIDAYYDSSIRSDLTTFDRQFGLADPSFAQYVQSGARGNSGWALETALDVEWAHVAAPGAAIVLVESANSSITNLMAAVDFARNLPGVSTISMSWGANENAINPATILGYDSTFTTPAGHNGITFVASSGDSGASGGVEWPASSANVMSVGGTRLNLTVTNDWSSETGWSGSGGGTSKVESEPSYQSGVQSSGFRQVPDVAYNADPNSAVYVYNRGWYAVGGTSAGAPQWAGLLAVANQGRVLAGLDTLNNGQAAVYTLPSSDFHDITSGSNGFSAGPGYDLVTGLGSPKANLVITDLAKPPAGGGGGGGGTGTGTGGTGSTGGTLPPPPKPSAVTQGPVLLIGDGTVSLLFFQHTPSASFITSNNTQSPAPQVPPQLLNAANPPRITTTATSSLIADVGSAGNITWTSDDVIDPATPALKGTPAGDEQLGKPSKPAKPQPKPMVPNDGASETPVEQAIDAVFAGEEAAIGIAQRVEPGRSTSRDLLDQPLDNSAAVALACVLGGYWALPKKEDERSRRWLLR
jgi:hypothetical protein